MRVPSWLQLLALAALTGLLDDMTWAREDKPPKKGYPSDLLLRLRDRAFVGVLPRNHRRIFAERHFGAPREVAEAPQVERVEVAKLRWSSSRAIPEERSRPTVECLRPQVEDQGAAHQNESEARRDESNQDGAREDRKNSE